MATEVDGHEPVIDDSTGESTTAVHAAPRQHKVSSMCSPCHLHRVFSGFNWEKIRVLDSIGFGGLLKIPRVRKVDEHFTLFLFQNLDSEKSVMRIGNGFELPIRDIDVHLALGIPHTGSSVVHDGLTPVDRVAEEVKTILFRGDSDGSLTMDYLEHILSREYPGGMSKQAERAFKVAAVLYSVGTFLAPLSSKPKVPTWILRTVVNTDLLSKFNWSAYVLWCLRRGAKLAQQQVASGCETISLHGCGFLLQVIFFDNMDFGALNQSHSLRPRAADFSQDQLDQFLQAVRLKPTGSRSSYASPKPRPIESVCYNWARRLEGETYTAQTEEMFPELFFPADSLKEGINLLQEYRSNIAEVLQQQHNKLLDQFIDSISASVRAPTSTPADTNSETRGRPVVHDDRACTRTKRPACRLNESSTPVQPEDDHGTDVELEGMVPFAGPAKMAQHGPSTSKICTVNATVGTIVQAEEIGHSAEGRGITTTSEPGMLTKPLTIGQAHQNIAISAGDACVYKLPAVLAQPYSGCNAPPITLRADMPPSHFADMLGTPNALSTQGIDAHNLLAGLGNPLLGLSLGTQGPRSTVGIRIAADLIHAVRRSWTNSGSPTVPGELVLVGPGTYDLLPSNGAETYQGPHDNMEPSTSMAPADTPKHTPLFVDSDSDEVLPVQVVESHSNFGPHPDELGLYHPLPNQKHASQVYKAYEAGCAQTHRDHFVHYFPVKLVIDGASLWSQMMRGGSWEVSVCDAIMRLYKSLDDRMYEPWQTRWRHFLPASFAAKVLGGGNYIDDPSIKASFIGRHIHYNVPDCSMLVVPVYIDGKWSCYFWNFASKMIHVLDPTMMRSTSTKVQRRHYLTVARLNAAIERCKDTFFVGWSVSMSGWPRHFPVNLSASCHRENSGVVATHFARTFTGRGLLWDLKPSEHGATRAELLMQLLSMGCNCGDIPDVMTELLDM